MANISSPLDQLRDLHLPEPIGLWPVAFGWYCVTIILVSIISIAAYMLYRKYKLARPKKKALRLLKYYQQQYKPEQPGMAQEYSGKISELLRRVALVYFPRGEVAGLHGTAWLDFLTSTSKGIDFNAVRFTLLELPFQPISPDMAIKIEVLFTYAKSWISQRSKPC